jgi:hypothetical protein
MTEDLLRDTLALVATQPEHCVDCFRLIRPGETYHQGKDNTVLCPTCFSNLLIGEDFDTIQATDQVAVDYGGGLLRLRCEGSAIVTVPQVVWYVPSSVAEAEMRTAEGQV